MDIQEKEALIAEIERFKEQALKMHTVQVLADTYERSSLFDYDIDSDGSVIWYKAQARQLWDFWQAAQAVPEGFVLVPREPTEIMAFHGESVLFDVFAEDAVRIYKAMIEVQEPDND